eukprot:432902-Amphidinium_carterae.1
MLIGGTCSATTTMLSDLSGPQLAYGALALSPGRVSASSRDARRSRGSSRVFCVMPQARVA